MKQLNILREHQSVGRIANPLLGVFILCAAALLLPSVSSGQNFPDFAKIFAQNSNSVVTVKVTKKISKANGLEIALPEVSEDSKLKGFFSRHFGQAAFATRQNAFGSGIFISTSGFIITAAHVVRDATKITIKTSGGKSYKAVLLGRDDESDIALLDVSRDNHPVPEFGDSRNLNIGEWVMSIGTPFGLELSASQGIISGLDRKIAASSTVKFLQTDVAVNPGSSGGPLFNGQGQVVGINSQIYSNSGGYQGVSFAVPIEAALKIATRLATNQGRSN